MPYTEIDHSKSTKFSIKSPRRSNNNNTMFQKLDHINNILNNCEDISVMQIDKLLQLREDLVEKIVGDNYGLIWDQIRSLGDLSKVDNISKDDLEAEARYGLIHAVHRFDTSRGIQFSTFASYCIFGFIRKFINNAQIIPVPSHKVGQVAAARKGLSEYYNTKKEQYEPIDPVISDIAQGTTYIDDIFSQYEGALCSEPGIENGVIGKLFFADMTSFLSESDQELFAKIYCDGMSIPDISRLTHEPVESLRNRHSSAIKQIRRHFSEEDKVSIRKTAPKKICNNVVISYSQCEDSPLKYPSIQDCLFITIRQYGDRGVLVKDLIKNINSTLGSDYSVKIKQVLGKWFSSENFVPEYKMVYNRLPKRGRRKISEKDDHRVGIIKSEDPYPEWHLSSYHDAESSNISSNTIPNPFRSDSISHIMFNLLKQYGRIGCPISDMVKDVQAVYGENCINKVKNTIRHWFFEMHKNGYHFVGDRHIVNTAGKKRQVDMSARIAIIPFNEDIPSWARR